MIPQIEKDLETIKQDRLTPQRTLEAQLMAIIRDYGRNIIRENGTCPCCGHKSEVTQ